jgi:hypothetical protein
LDTGKRIDTVTVYLSARSHFPISCIFFRCIRSIEAAAHVGSGEVPMRMRDDDSGSVHQQAVQPAVVRSLEEEPHVDEASAKDRA